VDDAKYRIVAAMRNMVEATLAAVEALEADNAQMLRGIEFLESGGGVTEGLKAFPIARRREDTLRALTRTNDARHELRLLAIALCVDEGMPPAVIADIWGVSRQRIGQYIREIKARGQAPQS